MAITFDQVPAGIRTPGNFVEIDGTGAVIGLVGMPSRILVLGQKLAAGTQAPLVPVRILDEAEAEAAFGRGSMLALMFRALKLNNRITETWAVAQVDDGGATAAAGSIGFGGAVTRAGTLTLYINAHFSRAGLHGRIRLAVAATDTPASIAASVAAAVNLQTALPVTAAVNGVDDAQVEFTARNAGEAGNGIDLRHSYYQGEALPDGLTATVTAMTGGAGNPDIGDAVAAFGDQWFTDIAMPYTDAANLTALETELADRFGPTVQKDGHAFAAARGAHAALTTLGNGRNSPHLSILYASGSPTAPFMWAAALAGIAAFEAKQDPARPLQNLAIKGVLAPLPQDRFTREERNLLLYDGIATFKVTEQGDTVVLERCITTYEQNLAGVDDPAFLDVETLKTLAYLRFTYNARFALKYPRHKLADSDTQFGAGQAVMTPRLADAEAIVLFREWEALGLVENFDQFKADLLSERDGNDVNRLNQLLRPDIVNQFRVLAGKIKFIL